MRFKIGNKTQGIQSHIISSGQDGHCLSLRQISSPKKIWVREQALRFNVLQGHQMEHCELPDTHNTRISHKNNAKSIKADIKVCTTEMEKNFTKMLSQTTIAIIISSVIVVEFVFLSSIQDVYYQELEEFFELFSEI
ncbi:hypothetical protein GQX74_007573 [Glossina fuscipes]|nr:hypothetical protein GQX74_007573 [Glossina fuscipes]